MKPVRLTDKAERELFQARDWFDDKSRGLGDRFLEEVRLRLARIEENPDVGIRLSRSTQGVVLSRFPYVIVFQQLPDETLVTRVCHGSRRSLR